MHTRKQTHTHQVFSHFFLGPESFPVKVWNVLRSAKAVFETWYGLGTQSLCESYRLRKNKIPCNSVSHSCLS